MWWVIARAVTRHIVVVGRTGRFHPQLDSGGMAVLVANGTRSVPATGIDGWPYDEGRGGHRWVNGERHAERACYGDLLGCFQDQVINGLLETRFVAGVFGADDPVGIDYQNEWDGLDSVSGLDLVVRPCTPVPPGDTAVGYRSSHCALVMVEGDAEQSERLPLESLR